LLLCATHWSNLLVELIKVIILGIVEGITEFLPISSTGHLIVAVALLQPNISLDGTFEIFIQLGAVVAVVFYYWRDLFRQVRTVRSDPAVRRLWLAIVVAGIPAALVGIPLRGVIKEVLFNPVTVAVALIVGGIALIVVERRPMMPASTTELSAVSLRQALFIGVAQTLALIPGASRSAVSIIGGMFTGLNRQTATQFSFYLAIPTLGGATVLELLLSLDEIQGSDLVYLIVGAVVSGIVAWIAIGWLLRYIATHTFVQFGIYRIIAGVVILMLSALALL
jgi:undecaprenyl-diphosphatase